MTTQGAPAESGLEDKVVVSGGRVRSIEEFTNWNGMPGGGYFDIRRVDKDKFISNSGSDEHGGGQSQGTLAHVLEFMDESLHEMYTKLFGLEGLTRENVESEIRRVLGTSPRRHKIVFG
jgi:hypothetical protein